MALLLLDGLDDLTSWQGVGGTHTIVLGRGGGNCLNMSSGSALLTFVIPPAAEHDTLTFGFAVRSTIPNSSGAMATLQSDLGATTHVTMILNSGGDWYLHRGASNIIDSGGVTVPGNTWAYLEIQVKLGDTGVGAATLRQNGVVVNTNPSLDTRNAGTKTVWDRIKIGGVNGTLQVDDLYIMTGVGDAFLGDIAVETLYPNGNGNANQWAGSDGNSTDNYLLVDEAGTPNTADYVRSSTSGQQDLYTLTDLFRTTGNVVGVCHVAHAAKTDSGARQVRVVNRRGVDTKSAAFDLTTSHAPYHQALAVDPETAAPFTIANVNALQSGIEVV